MGELQVEVKILKNAPILFAWENKYSHVVEGYLITCPCQQLGLQGAGNDADASTIYRRGDREWAAKLAQALEVSEVVSFSSLEPCVSISKGIHLMEGSNEEDVIHEKKRRKKVKKSRKEKKMKLGGLENGVGEEGGVSLHDAGDGHGNADEVVQEQTVATTESGGEHSQKKSQSSAHEDLSSSDECHEGQKDSQGSYEDVGNTKAVSEDSGSSCQPVADSNQVDKKIDSVSEGALNSAVNNNSHGKKGLASFDVPTLNLDQVYETRNEEHLNNVNVNKNQVIPSAVHFTLPDGKEETAAIGKNPITITHVTSATADLGAPVTDDQALINAISSIMEIYPGAVIDLPQTGQQQVKPLDHGAMHQRESKVSFIRSLTEEERKNMFKFRSDTYERNLKMLDEGGKCFLCEHCGKILTLSVKKRHMETHSEVPRERNCVCDQCGKKFHNKTNLKHHLESHRPEPSYKCRYCAKKYKTVYGRTMHERAHFNVCAGQCDKCGRKFKDFSKLRSHQTFGCETRRAPRRTYRTHKAEFTVSQEDPGSSTCNICEKVVPTESLPSHMDTHAEKMFTCPICKKIVKYTTKYTHMNVHSDKRNFTCHVCARSFKTKTTLNTHMRTHTGERPLNCRYCERTFSRYSSREVHETTHTGERPFPCTICNKGWKDRPTYMAHMKRHHPGAPLFYRRKSSMMNQLASVSMVIEETGAPGN